MNPQDPLAGLQPLRVPVAVGWWPPALGWWLLLLLGLITLIWLGYWLWRRHRANAYRRRALRQLALIHQNYRANPDPAQFASAINGLLKAVALLRYPRRRIAAANGEDWLAFLNSTMAKKTSGQSFNADFAQACYRSQAPQLDIEQVHSAAKSWIQSHHGEPG